MSYDENVVFYLIEIVFLFINKGFTGSVDNDYFVLED